MRRILVSLLPAAALSLASATAFAQQVYTPNGGTYPDGGGVTMPADTYTPAPGGPPPGPAAILGAPFAMFGAQQHMNCGVLRDFNGRMTAVCGP